MTYSIVARDPDSGELGVAVQSHWFSVGAVVPWAVPGVGAVATQAAARVAYGPLALREMRSGASAGETLERLLADDANAAFRQVAVIDASGQTATHTGEACIGFAGHVDGVQVSCQANMMASETVWPAMLEAYNSSSGSLAERLLSALDAAEAAGGDARGRQSAALLVVPGSGEDWETLVSLRVEDHPDPLGELRRLVRLAQAYRLATRADELTAAGRHDEAGELYRGALERAPDNHELRFWAGIGAAQAGDMDHAVADVQAAITAQPGWRDLLARLPEKVAPAARALMAEIMQRERRS